MTESARTDTPTRFTPLEQADFQRLEHAGYLKGLLQPFKGKGSLETWASQCAALRDDVIGLAQRRVLPQARAYPFSLLDVQLAQQATGAGTTFLRWRNLDRSSMGVALWEALLANPATPASLIDERAAGVGGSRCPSESDCIVCSICASGATYPRSRILRSNAARRARRSEMYRSESK